MWRRLSGSDQMPLAVESPKCAPQPSFEASVNICVEGGVKEHASDASDATEWVACEGDLTTPVSLLLLEALSET